MSHFVMIDGNNLYIRSRRNPKEWVEDGGHRYFPHPCIEAVEAVVDHCRREKVAFKLFFDSTSRFHFDWWAQHGGEGAEDVRARYNALCNLGDGLVTIAPGRTEADMFKLAEADALLKRGLDPYIVTQDKFRDRLERYPELLVWNEKLDRPLRTLPGYRSDVHGECALVFARLPSRDGKLHEVRLPMRGKAQGRRRDEAHEPRQPGPKASRQTLIVDGVTEFSQHGLRLHGNGNVFSLSLARLALLQAERPVWPLTVGRSEDSDLIVRDAFAAVSRQQVVFDRDAKGNFSVTDAGSANGSWLNGQRLERDVATRVPRGPGVITFVGSADAAPVHLFYENSPAEAAGNEERAPGGCPILHVRLPGGRHEQYEITSYPFTVGAGVSGAGASLDFPDVISVSREHLRIMEKTGDDGFLVNPIGRNGTAFKGVVQKAPFVLPFADEVVLSPRDARTGNVAVWITRN